MILISCLKYKTHIIKHQMKNFSLIICLGNIKTRILTKINHKQIKTLKFHRTDKQNKLFNKYETASNKKTIELTIFLTKYNFSLKIKLYNFIKYNVIFPCKGYNHSQNLAALLLLVFLVTVI